MNYIKRALLSVWKHKVKNLILLIIFTLVSTLILASICVLHASQAAGKQAKSTIGTEVTVYWNNDKTPGVGNSKYPISRMALNELSHLKHVKAYNYVDSLSGGVANGFSMFVNEKFMQQQQEYMRNQSKKLNRPDLANFVPADIILYGALDTSKLDQFLSGGYELVSGRYIGTGDFGKSVAMISKSVADKNNLKLGDKITICNQTDAAKKNVFTTVGIFTTPAVDPRDAGSMELNPADTIFLSFPEVGLFDVNYNYTPYDINHTVQRADYFLDDPANVDNFIGQAKKIVNMKGYEISSNTDLYREAIAPLGKIENMNTLMAWASGLAGLLILGLIVAISLKGRGREFGILLAMGEKRAKIIGQVLVETLIPVCIAFCPAAFAGNLMAGQLGKAMFAGSVKSQSKQLLDLYATNPDIYRNYVSFRSKSLGGDVVKTLFAMPINKINIAISPSEYCLVGVICLIIVIIAVIIPCVNILRLKPRRILTKL